MDAIRTKFVTRNQDARDLSLMHLISLQCMITLYSVSQWVQHGKNMCKDCINHRKQLCQFFGCFITLQWWSSEQSDHVTSCNQHGGPWEIWIFVFRKCWYSWHLMWLWKSLWPPGRKETNFPCSLWPPKFQRIIITVTSPSWTFKVDLVFLSKVITTHDAASPHIILQTIWIHLSHWSMII